MYPGLSPKGFQDTVSRFRDGAWNRLPDRVFSWRVGRVTDTLLSIWLLVFYERYAILAVTDRKTDHP